MIPPIEHIVHKRHDKRRQCRMLALVLTTVAVVLGSSTAIYESQSHLQPWGGTGVPFLVRLLLQPFFLLAMGFFIAAIPLGLLDRRLSRWLVPMPDRRCPQCGHEILTGQQPVCLECGGVLPAALCAPENKALAAASPSQ